MKAKIMGCLGFCGQFFCLFVVVFLLLFFFVFFCFCFFVLFFVKLNLLSLTSQCVT